jgi:tripartite-type tricarboxylate transporter receptor subunit TctC
MKIIAVICCAFLIMCPYAVSASDYPVKPIRMIVPYPPGGGSDIAARVVGQKLSEVLGQQVIIENRGGAAGVIGTELAAQSAPDGYTLLFAVSTIIVTPLLNSKVRYDPVKDFEPVSLVAVNPFVLVANSAVPASSIKELIALAKAKPGKLNYASSGQGGPNHLAMELFKSMAGIDIVHVPYKGAGPAITDVVSGEVQLMINNIPPLLQWIKSGKLRVLGVSDESRSSVLPDIPTIHEAGVPKYNYTSWYAVFTPAKTPKDIVAKINAQIVKVLADPGVVQVFTRNGFGVRSCTPEELGQFIREDSDRLKAVIRSAGIKTE